MNTGSMNIYARQGDRVVFANPTYGYEYQQEEAAKLLKVGETYTVRYTVVGSSSTDVYLEEIPTHKFNSVLFVDAPELPEPDGFEPGIHITSIVQPETGGIIAMHCPECRATVFVLHQYSTKPPRGDFHLLEGLCENWTHGMGFSRDIVTKMKVAPGAMR
jgi:hypothetical protein